MKKQTRIYMLSALAALVSTSLASPDVWAQTVEFSDNFENYTITPPATDLRLPASATKPSYNFWARDGDSNRDSRVTLDEGNLFGAGDNQYLRIFSTADATADNNLLTTSFASVTQGKLSFDFLVAPGAISSNRNFLVMLLSDTSVGDFSANTPSQAVTGFFISDGLVHQKTAGKSSRGENNFAFTTGQKHTLSIVFNNADGTLTYEGGSVSSGYADFWLDGSKIATWVLGQGDNLSNGAGVDGLSLRIQKGSDYAEILLDNLELTSIPEPSALVLTGGALLVAILSKKGIAKSLQR